MSSFPIRGANKKPLGTRILNKSNQPLLVKKKPLNSNSSTSTAASKPTSQSIENEILFSQIQLLQIDFILKEKIRPGFNLKMAHLKRSCTLKTREFASIMNKLEEYKELREREAALDLVRKECSKFYNNPSIPSLETLRGLKQEYEKFKKIISTKKNMMTISAGRQVAGGGHEKIHVNPHQISSAMSRLLPVLEEEVARILQMPPIAPSGCLAEKIALLQEKHRNLSESIEKLEEAERIKDVEWNQKRQEMKEQLRLLCQSYLNPSVQELLNQKMQALSPL